MVGLKDSHGTPSSQRTKENDSLPYSPLLLPVLAQSGCVCGPTAAYTQTGDSEMMGHPPVGTFPMGPDEE